MFIYIANQLGKIGKFCSQTAAFINSKSKKGGKFIENKKVLPTID